MTTTFAAFEPPLCAPILAHLDTLGFSHMTPVQAATLPLFLAHKDVCVDACTGSGKTLAFVLPMVQVLKTQMDSGALTAPKTDVAKLLGMVISPTRELARQICACATDFFAAAMPGVQVLLLVGGTSVERDLQMLRDAKTQCCVIVGTPGRTEDVLKRCAGAALDVRSLEMLVLDEADTLLDMGFEVSINAILSFLPKQRRTGLFSATQTQEVKALARAGLRNPATISVQVAAAKNADQAQITPSTLQNHFCVVEHDQRLSALHRFVSDTRQREHTNLKIIVFFSTCSAVDFFGRVLELLMKKQHELDQVAGADVFPVVALHGKMPQKKRTQNYDQFVALQSGMLVCTDVVARGIDLPDVQWIVQYDPPQDPNFFVHRVGRTARAGRSGAALSFLSRREDAYVNFLRLRKVPCEELALPLEDMTDVLPWVKQWILADRDLLEKGTKAFISFVRSYKEHQCQFIFRFKDLDLSRVARGFALIKLPKINELRNVKIDFDVDPEIDTKEIKFKDKAREKERQKKLAQIAKDKQAREQAAPDKKRPRQEEPIDDIDISNKKMKQAPRRREKKKGLHQQIVEEWDELAHEETLYKRLKKGKITKEEYEKALMGQLSDDEGGGDSGEESGADGKSEKKPTAAELRRQERFQKKEQVKRKTGEQRKEAAKREERIRARKKAMHVRKGQMKAQRRGGGRR